MVGVLSFVCLSVEFGNLGGMSNDLKSLRSIPVYVFSLVHYENTPIQIY